MSHPHLPQPLIHSTVPLRPQWRTKVNTELYLWMWGLPQDSTKRWTITSPHDRRESLCVLEPCLRCELCKKERIHLLCPSRELIDFILCTTKRQFLEMKWHTKYIYFKKKRITVKGRFSLHSYFCSVILYSSFRSYLSKNYQKHTAVPLITWREDYNKACCSVYILQKLHKSSWDSGIVHTTLNKLFMFCCCFPHLQYSVFSCYNP